jgi:biopolymer transport protein ExbD
MNLGSDFHSDAEVVNEINMTPMIDVMLVLLIIFIVTLPVINDAVKVDLPQMSNKPVEVKERSVQVSIDASGDIYWDKHSITREQLPAKVMQSAAENKANTPVVRIYADKTVQYESIAFVLTTVQKGGLSKIDFVTEPTAQ